MCTTVCLWSRGLLLVWVCVCTSGLGIRGVILWSGEGIGDTHHIPTHDTLPPPHSLAHPPHTSTYHTLNSHPPLTTFPNLLPPPLQWTERLIDANLAVSKNSISCINHIDTRHQRALKTTGDNINTRKTLV